MLYSVSLFDGGLGSYLYNLIMKFVENAATTIQSHFRRYAKHRDYLRIRDAALVLQGAAFALLSVKKKVSVKEIKSKGEQGSLSYA